MIFANPGSTALAEMTGTTWGASLFWAYAGAFDLFIGRWIYFDASERQMPSWLVSIILTVTILFGPLGFALYAVARWLKKDPAPG